MCLANQSQVGGLFKITPHTHRLGVYIKKTYPTAPFIKFSTAQWQFITTQHSVNKKQWIASAAFKIFFSSFLRSLFGSQEKDERERGTEKNSAARDKAWARLADCIAVRCLSLLYLYYYCYSINMETVIIIIWVKAMTACLQYTRHI